MGAARLIVIHRFLRVVETLGPGRFQSDLPIWSNPMILSPIRTGTSVVDEHRCPFHSPLPAELRFFTGSRRSENWVTSQKSSFEILVYG
jgi:hypothetical protein